MGTSGEQAKLGELEAAVMVAVWELGSASVADVRRSLGEERAAYTTVMTVLSRLTDKGLLRRQKDGRAFIYEATREQQAVAVSLMQGVVDRLYGGSSSRAIAHLIEADDDADDAELDRLEELIRKKRRARS